MGRDLRKLVVADPVAGKVSTGSEFNVEVLIIVDPALLTLLPKPLLSNTVVTTFGAPDSKVIVLKSLESSHREQTDPDSADDEASGSKLTGLGCPAGKAEVIPHFAPR